MKKNFKLLGLFSILFICVFCLTSCCTRDSGFKKEVEFKSPDIKDDFCGPVMNFKYCKCAFHNEFCDDIGMKKSEAKKYVEEEYEKWLEQEKLVFKADCESSGGIYDSHDAFCVYCDTENGYVKKGDECVKSSEYEEEEIIEDEEDEEEEEEEEEKSISQEDCNERECLVNGQCLPMNVECKGGASMKSWGEVCALAAQTIDGQPFSTDICYCLGNFCYMDQQCQEMEVDRFCGNSVRTTIKDAKALCRYWQREDIDDTELVWGTYCDCKQGYCKIVKGDGGSCEEPPDTNQLKIWCEGINAQPKSFDNVCVAEQRKAEGKHTMIFDWCQCNSGYDEDWEKEICVKIKGN